MTGLPNDAPPWVDAIKTFPGPVIAPSSDGWISLPGPDGADGLHVRVRRQNGRLVITEMYLHDAQELTSGALRELSIARLEAGINALADLTSSLPAEVDAATAFRLDAEADEPSLAALRARVPEVGAPGTPRPSREPLGRPSGDLDEYYRRVAQIYQEYAATTNGPAAAIAAESGVPVTTAHRWVREARRRGHLPPARKGRAG